MNGWKPIPKHVMPTHYGLPTWLGLLCVAALLGVTPAAPGDDEYNVVWFIDAGETYYMDEDCAVECLFIYVGGKLYTNGHTLTITGPSGLVVCWGGRLIVDEAGTVILSGGGRSLVYGCVELDTRGSTLRITSEDHSIAGWGRIVGRSNDAEIVTDREDPAGLTIGGGFTIEGALRICLDLVNNGRVCASDGTSVGSRDRLTLDSGTYTGSGVFEVSAVAACLEFDATGVTATDLTATFVVSNGTLRCETDVRTSREGSLYFTGGCISVEAGMTATFN